MTRTSSPAPPGRDNPPDLRAAGRFGRRSLVGWLFVIGGAMPFLILWLLVRDAAAPLERIDHAVADGLNDAVHGYPVLVRALQTLSNLAGTATAVVVLVVTAGYLLAEKRWRLAAFTVVTGVGLGVLIPVIKALVKRARPIVDVPVVHTPGNPSFPSGHAMGSVVVWGTVVLVALPSVRRAARRWLLVAVAAMALMIGFTRLALGVHFLSDVLAGWTLGVAWLAAMITAFRAWPGAYSDPGHLAPLETDEVSPGEVRTRIRGGTALPAAAASRRLAGAGLVIAIVLTILGFLLTGPWRDGWLVRWDRDVAAWAAGMRTPGRTDVLEILGSMAGISGAIVGTLLLSVLALAATGSGRVVVFVLTAVGGESLLYLVVSTIVDRPRPDVANLTHGLPPTSWPSGHVAAAVALYGGLAVLVLRYSSLSGPYRWPAIALPVLMAVLVGISRVYVGAHHPTDVLAGAALGATWLWCCVTWLLPPAAGTHDDVAGRGGSERGATAQRLVGSQVPDAMLVTLGRDVPRQSR